MTTTKKITAYAIAIIICSPLLMFFNNDESRMYINVIGMAYGYGLYKFGKFFLPRCVLDLFR